MAFVTSRTMPHWALRLVATWPVWRPYLYPVAALAVVGLIALQARSLDWPAAWRAVRAYDLQTLAIAAAFAAAAHLLYTGFDQLGRAYVGHRLARWRVSVVAFVSYAFNLNLGTLVGAVGMRMRLYLLHGLRAEDVARVIGFSVVTNWVGYAALTGAVLASGLADFPEGAAPSATTLRLAGIALLTLPAFYLLECVFAKRRSVSLYGHHIELPPTRIALLQIAIAMLEWSAIAAIPYALLGEQLSYATVLATSLIAAVAGVVTRVPAGLGVIEFVFLWLLAGARTQGELLAALLTYRIVFYWAPLALAAATYLGLEAAAHNRRATT